MSVVAYRRPLLCWYLNLFGKLFLLCENPLLRVFFLGDCLCFALRSTRHYYLLVLLVILFAGWCSEVYVHPALQHYAVLPACCTHLSLP